jgi:hypothetical protein
LTGVITVLAVASSAATLTQADFDSTYGIFQRMAMISKSQPAWAMLVNFAMSTYYVADDIVFFTNRRRRALHDYLADTVVVHL